MPSLTSGIGGPKHFELLSQSGTLIDQSHTFPDKAEKIVTSRLQKERHDSLSPMPQTRRRMRLIIKYLFCPMAPLRLFCKAENVVRGGIKVTYL